MNKHHPFIYNAKEVRTMPYPQVDIDRLLGMGFIGILIIIGGAVLFGIIWGIKEGLIKPVAFKFGDRGFLEIFGYRTPILIKGGTWFYIEGIITQSKTSVLSQPGKIVRRDIVNGEIVITAVDYYYHVVDTREMIKAAIYGFVDPATTGGLSNGVNIAFQRYVESQICWAAMQLVAANKLSVSLDLIEEFKELRGKELTAAGVALDQALLMENAPPNEYATAGVLGRFIPVPATPHDAR